MLVAVVLEYMEPKKWYCL